MSVKRYFAGHDVYGDIEMKECAHGDYASYEDYAALQEKLDAETHRADQNAVYLEALTERMLTAEKERDALAAENAALKAFFETGINASFEGCDFFGDHMQSRALELGLIREEFYCKDQHENMVVDPSDLEDGDTVYFINETPATDAYLNSVRAEGVEMLAEHHLQKAERYSAGGNVADSKARITMYNITEDFAAQLRAGEAK